MTHTVPDPFAVKRVSTHRDGAGEILTQWVIAEPEREAMAQLQREFVRELCETVTPRKGLSKAPKHSNKDIMVGYPLGDHHFGMLSWAPETGSDYDSKIAKELLAASIDYLVDTAPPAEQALFCNLGDLLHMDNRTNRTPQSGHILDVDSRYARVIRIAAYGMAYAVERLLQKHQQVKLVNVAGNHDMDSASWVSLVLEAYFRHEPRVTVEVSPAKFLFHQFGKNMIGMTHGDTLKLPQLAGVMASYQPAMWGETTYRVAWTGHVHHSQTVNAKDISGAKCESFGVLPPLDAFAASRGYMAQREMHAITFKRAGGELGRSTFNAD